MYLFCTQIWFIYALVLIRVLKDDTFNQFKQETFSRIFISQYE